MVQTPKILLVAADGARLRATVARTLAASAAALRNRRVGQVRRRIRAGRAWLSPIYVAGMKPGILFSVQKFYE